MFNMLWTPFWQQPLPPTFQRHGPYRIQHLGYRPKLTQAPTVRAAIPRDAYVYRLTIGSPLAMQGYSLQILGYLKTDEDPPNTALQITILGQPDILMLYAVHRVVHQHDNPLWLEALWHPQGEETFIQLCGLQHPHTKRHRQGIWKGLSILQGRNKGGRRKGSKYYGPEDKDLFILEACTAIHKLQGQHRKVDTRTIGEFIRIPGEPDPGLSRKTIERYLTEYGLAIEDLIEHLALMAKNWDPVLGPTPTP